MCTRTVDMQFITGTSSGQAAGPVEDADEPTTPKAKDSPQLPKLVGNVDKEAALQCWKGEYVHIICEPWVHSMALGRLRGVLRIPRGDYPLGSFKDGT